MDPEKITLRASDPDGPRMVWRGHVGSRSMMAHVGSDGGRGARGRAVRKGTELAAKDMGGRAERFWNSTVRAATA